MGLCTLHKYNCCVSRVLKYLKSEAESNNRLLILQFYRSNCISIILHKSIPLNLKFGWRKFPEIYNRSLVFSEQKLDHNLEQIMN